MRDELIDGDLGALIARRFVLLEVRFIPVLRREDVASAGSNGLIVTMAVIGMSSKTAGR